MPPLGASTSKVCIYITTILYHRCTYIYIYIYIYIVCCHTHTYYNPYTITPYNCLYTSTPAPVLRSDARPRNNDCTHITYTRSLRNTPPPRVTRTMVPVGTPRSPPPPHCLPHPTASPTPNADILVSLNSLIYDPLFVARVIPYRVIVLRTFYARVLY